MVHSEVFATDSRGGKLICGAGSSLGCGGESV